MHHVFFAATCWKASARPRGKGPAILLELYNISSISDDKKTIACRWYVPVIWGAVSVACLYHIHLHHTEPSVTTGLLLVFGVVLWQFTEYCIHRFLFHIQPTSYWGITLHFTFHGCHHKWPLDSLRLVFPPVPAAPIIAGVFFAMHKILPKVSCPLLCTLLLPWLLCAQCCMTTAESARL